MSRNSEKDPQSLADTLERMGEQLGGATARAATRGAEIAGGVMGSMVDTVIGTLGDWWSTGDASRAAQTFDNAEATCRQHFQKEANSAGSARERNYDEVRPLYQLGFVASQNPSFENRDFREVEPELEHAWRSAGTPEDWSDVRGFVDFGYTQNRIDRLDL